MNSKKKLVARRELLGASFAQRRPTLFSRASRLTPRASHPPRRGILLLVVLSLLTLFLMIGMAFIVTANQYRRANKTYARITEAANAPVRQGALLDEVINQLLRDTNNQFSALRYHSLLRDMYGNDGFTAYLAPESGCTWDEGAASATNSKTGGQFLELNLDDGMDNEKKLPTDYFGNQLTSLDGLKSTRNAYNGLVVTFLDGDAKGQSTRIIGYSAVTHTFRVISFKLADGSNVTTPTELNGSKILINGRPFNGTGAGFNPLATTGARLNTTERVSNRNRPLALLPNAAFFVPENIYLNDNNDVGPYFSPQWTSLDVDQRQRLVTSMGPVGQGGSDESYDAVDFQNMALAMLPLNPIRTAIPNLDAESPPNRNSPPDTLGNMVLPSFHRPALLNYWRQQLIATDSTLEAEPNLLRKVLLRPNWHDHPDFTGSNPDLANLSPQEKLLRSIYGPWDVDNDNDGIRDSIWVDIGAPVMEGPDGRLVKPLAAILVLDMDGRLNLNAHGTREHLKTDLTNSTPTPDDDLPVAKSLADDGTTAVWSSDLPRGIGYGPAEISLEPVVGDPDNTANNLTYFDDLLVGNSTSDYAGRYGRNPTDTLNATGPQPGEAGFPDLSAQLKMQGVPQWFNNNQLPTAYVSPPDFLGRYALGLNNFGQPVYEAFEDTIALNTDTPYELDLSLRASRGDSATAVDGPFSIAELERILRAYDVDAGTLPTRLWSLAGQFRSGGSTTNTDELNQWRTLLTTDSYDLPVPSVNVPQWMLLGKDKQLDNNPEDNTVDDFEDVMGRTITNTDTDAHVPRTPTNATLTDLIEYHVRIGLAKSLGGKPKDVPVDYTDDLRRVMSTLMSTDSIDGLRLDINRPIGNGRDDDGDRIVDEPGENERPFWQLNSSLNASADFVDKTGEMLDDIDRDGDGIIEAWERGDTDASGVLSDQERVQLHNFRRQLLARHLYVLAMTLVDPLPIPQAGPTDPAYLKNRAARARQLAQWAINVVDFRDPDNIMTAFEYDIDPFDGWFVDGDIAGFDPVTNQPEWAGTDNKVATKDDTGGVVWGTERPEIIMTETLSWHDRATEDRGTGFEDAVTDENLDGKMDTKDSGEVGTLAGTGHDTDYDQRKRPQGATFIEFYNPWSDNPATNEDIARVERGVDLSAFVAGAMKSPVWRLQVNKCGSQFLYGGGPDRDYDDPDFRVRPQNPDRTVYFTDFDPEEVNNSWDNDGTAFYSSLAGSANHGIVKPGGYCVVGSGKQINGLYEATIGDQTPKSGADATRAIVLGPGSARPVVLRDDDGKPLRDQDAALTGGVFAKALHITTPENHEIHTSVAIIDQPRRFSVSEPANGYPDHLFNSVWNENTEEYQPILDIPLDNQRIVKEPGLGGGVAGHVIDGQLIDSATDPRWFLGTNPNSLLQMRKDNEGRLRLADKGSTVRTIPAFSWIYLQRLANPTMQWNPMPKLPDGTNHPGHNPDFPVNPYMTIDSMGTNVTVFTGQATEEKRRQGATIESYNNADAMYSFASVQRGRLNDGDPKTLAARLGETQDDFRRMKTSSARNGGFLQDPQQGVNPTANSPQNLWGDEHIGRLGANATRPYGTWLNKSGPLGDGLRNEIGSRTHFFNSVPDCTLGFMNEPFRANGGSKNTPGQPFPWMTWNNRPYASSGELLQVPAFRSSQLAKTFSFLKKGKPPTGTSRGDYSEQYSGKVRRGVYPTRPGFEQFYPELVVDGPFGHLLNFFRTERYDPNTPLDPSDDEGIAGLYRVLDYVHVPSRFVGAETWLSPATFGISTVPVDNTNDPRYLRQPPFNQISNYRDPGRVNLNTIFSQEVSDGIFHVKPGTLPHPSPPGSSSVDSRRGYVGDNMLALDSNYPTFFVNPFRSSDAGNLVPLDTATSDMTQEGVDCTLLRSSAITGPPTGSPLLASDVPEAYRNSNRNPYFRYQPITRLSSFSTTRSNVYAVWVTIGFFEVEDVPQWADANQAQFNSDSTLYDKVYPEGYQFGKESGSETGAIKRIRKFALIDRTIPVAFEPGKNHNVDHAIRLQRRIE